MCALGSMYRPDHVLHLLFLSYKGLISPTKKRKPLKNFTVLSVYNVSKTVGDCSCYVSYDGHLTSFDEIVCKSGLFLLGKVTYCKNAQDYTSE